jgi:hypothetical protein
LTGVNRQSLLTGGPSTIDDASAPGAGYSLIHFQSEQFFDPARASSCIFPFSFTGLRCFLLVVIAARRLPAPAVSASREKFALMFNARKAARMSEWTFARLPNAFQADDEGSIPFTRFNVFNDLAETTGSMK